MALRQAYFLTLLTLAVAQQIQDPNGHIPQLNIGTIAEQSLTHSTIAPLPSSNQNLTQTNRNSDLLVSLRPIPNKARQRDILQRIGEGSQAFALDMFVRLVEIVSKVHQDLVLSPFAIWSLLLPLTEGAAGTTLNEMRTTMHLDDDQMVIRDAFRTIKSYLSFDTPTVSVQSIQALFTDKNQPISRDFESTIEREYGADLMSVDFLHPAEAANDINAVVRNATKNLLNNVFLPQDLDNAKLVLLSALFFKGQWKMPFNASLTRSEPFFDEQNNNIGNVEMMTQMGNFNFTRMDNLEGHVLELPYGKENRLSMLILLPKKGVSLLRVAQNLQKVGITAIFDKLVADFDDYGNEDIEVFMPKFSSTKHYSMSMILNEMGIKDLFHPDAADLSKIGKDLFVSSIIQSTRIIVDEEGTTAGAYAASVLVNKASPTKIYLNRPFLYLIVEKLSNALLFCGHIMNPNNVQYAD